MHLLFGGLEKRLVRPYLPREDDLLVVFRRDGAAEIRRRIRPATTPMDAANASMSQSIANPTRSFPRPMSSFVATAHPSASSGSSPTNITPTSNSSSTAN